MRRFVRRIRNDKIGSFFRCAFCLIFFLAVGARAEEQFAHASPQRKLVFPDDHGAHPRFQTEWWYYTGHLQIEGSNQTLPEFGYQLTFFRRAGHPHAELLSWDQHYMAHAAISDHRTSTFYASKRQASGGLEVAGAQEKNLNVWIQGWEAKRLDSVHRLQARYETQGTQIELQLDLEELTQAVLHGAGGYSKKGACATCASHYYSFPGMKTKGMVKVGQEKFQVSGLSWMDHEFMSSALDADQVGWDWFAFMNSKGFSLMLFALRTANGDWSFSSGTITSEGHSETLTPKMGQIKTLRTWRSPVSGALYPSRWRIELPEKNISFEAEPRFAAQEHVTKDSDGIAYWEGALSTSQSGLMGYAELTGYAKELKQDF